MIVSFDVGIKNLSFCTFKHNEDGKYTLSQWDIINLCGDKLSCKYNTKNGVCGKTATYKCLGITVCGIHKKQFQTFQKDPLLRKWNFWGYIDARDVAQACLLAMESKLKGAENFIIAADDTVMEEDNKSLLDKVFPNIQIKGEIGKNKTLLSNDKAKKILGFKPEYSWKNIN